MDNEYRKRIEQYQNSLFPIIAMHKDGMLSDEQYEKMESFLAKKYCIKKSSLYRSNYLINSPLRAINIMQKEKEEQNAECNRNTSITKIEKGS